MTFKAPTSFALVLVVSACAAGSASPGPAAPGAASPPSAGDPNAPVASPPTEPAGAVAGHPTGDASGSTWRVKDLGVSVPDEWRTCSAASECKLVVTTCCDHCNGGKAVAVNASHVKDVEAKHPKSCDNVACTERGCRTRAACQSNRCVLEWESAS